MCHLFLMNVPWRSHSPRIRMLGSEKQVHFVSFVFGCSSCCIYQIYQVRSRIISTLKLLQKLDYFKQMDPWLYPESPLSSLK